MVRDAGAGKTTLATALAKQLNLPVYYEPVIDNVYLADFYQNPAKYSFALQVRPPFMGGRRSAGLLSMSRDAHRVLVLCARVRRSIC